MVLEGVLGVVFLVTGVELFARRDLGVERGDRAFQGVTDEDRDRGPLAERCASVPIAGVPVAVLGQVDPVVGVAVAVGVSVGEPVAVAGAALVLLCGILEQREAFHVEPAHLAGSQSVCQH